MKFTKKIILISVLLAITLLIFLFIPKDDSSLSFDEMCEELNIYKSIDDLPEKIGKSNKQMGVNDTFIYYPRESAMFDFRQCRIFYEEKTSKIIRIEIFED